MLIKVATHESTEDSFRLFDNCENVQFKKTPYSVDSWDKFRSYFMCPHYSGGRIYDLHPEVRFYIYCFEQGNIPPKDPWELQNIGQVYWFNLIKFDRSGKTYEILFDKEGYICNDDGKTLERVFGSGAVEGS